MESLVESVPGWVPIAVGSGVVLTLGAYLLRRRRSHKFTLPRGERERDVVYLYQFPRFPLGPCASPFCLKMELFLRMNQIPHKVIGTRRMGPKSKMPYICYNDQVVADSDFIVEFLMKEFKLSIDDHLDATQRAIGHVTQQMLEECTFWTAAHYRWVQQADTVAYWFTSKPSLTLRLGMRYFSGQVAKTIHSQGIGRHSNSEIAHIARKDLQSLSTLLGDKLYLLGDTPSSHDAAMFGMLALQLWYLSGCPHETYIDTEAENLRHYCERVRNKWFPDWEQLCTKA